MRSVLLLMAVLVGCGAPAEGDLPVKKGPPKSDGTPKVIVDENRPVMDADHITTEAPRNQCSLEVGKYILQYVPVKSTCGELADEVGDMRDLDPHVLSIPRVCTLGHYYNQDVECTVTTELVCITADGCEETRYQDFDWSPTQDGKSWYGDGVLKLKRVCGAQECEGTYHVAVFPQ